MDPVERILALLRAELPRAAVQIVASGRDRFLDLPASPSAEYSFRLWFYEDDSTGGSREISARLPGHAQAETCFWYWPFDGAQFNTAAALSDAFDRSLLTLIRRPTRIVQKRGLRIYSSPSVVSA